jgi:uncharacterized protein (UPF0332 family)
MEVDMKPKKQHNIDEVGKDIYSKAGTVSEKVREKYKDLVCSVLLKQPAGEHLDVVFLADDLNNIITDNKVTEIKMAASDIGFSAKIDVGCDVMLASVFWDQFLSRDVAILDLLRDSFIIHDNGFLRPVQELLVTGKIRPSKESVNVYFVKAERSMKTANTHVSKAIIDLYWAVIDAAHAAVMVAGITPPSPKDLAETVRKELVVRNLVHKRCAEIVDRLYNAAKQIMHRKQFDFSGKEFDSYLADADFFIKEISEFIKEHTKEK